MSTRAGAKIKAGDFAGIYQAYTPSLTGFTLGNGTLLGRYTRQNQLIVGWAMFTFGSTSSVASTPAISMPAAPHASFMFGMPVGVGWIYDSSASLRLGCIAHYWNSPDKIFLTNPGLPSGETVTSGTPFAWATGDQFFIQFQYEAAS